MRLFGQTLLVERYQRLGGDYKNVWRGALCHSGTAAAVSARPIVEFSNKTREKRSPCSGKERGDRNEHARVSSARARTRDSVSASAPLLRSTGLCAWRSRRSDPRRRGRP